MDLRKTTGDDRRRTHDMNTAVWIPDVFMERVINKGNWTLFSPDETNNIRDLSGVEFTKAYMDLEAKAANGEIKVFKQVSAVKLWRKLLASVFETGHPWLNFSDAWNERYTNKHVGTIHSSNLCFGAEEMPALADGRKAISFETLYEENKSFPVYSGIKREDGSGYDRVIRNAVCVKTGTKELGILEFTNGITLRCTDDHIFYTPNGFEVEAKHTVGLRIDTTYFDCSGKPLRVKSFTLTGEVEDVYCLQVEDTHKFYLATSYNIDSETKSAILVSNCTEIGLHTNEKEIAVCNLGSINIANHIVDNYKPGDHAFGLDIQKINDTVTTAIRMLDNVIDYNFYAVEEAEYSNKKHRPIGLGLMGWQDYLYKVGIPFESEEAVELANYVHEVISYYAINASSDLAKERGKYSTYEGSLWDQDIFPMDSYHKLIEYRKYKPMEVIDYPLLMDWNGLSKKVKEQGMRNSNVMAIAPSATISNIVGCSQSVEPRYLNRYVKSNLSGEFTVVNEVMENELKLLGYMDRDMEDYLRLKDGDIQNHPRIPQSIKNLYKCAFDIDPSALIHQQAARQKWIDQGGSLNLYMKNVSGPKLSKMYKLAWIVGLKATYYLRAMNETDLDKEPEELTGIDAPMKEKVTAPKDTSNIYETNRPAPKVCSIEDPGCEACQ